MFFCKYLKRRGKFTTTNKINKRYTMTINILAKIQQTFGIPKCLYKENYDKNFSF